MTLDWIIAVLLALNLIGLGVVARQQRRLRSTVDRTRQMTQRLWWAEVPDDE